MATIDKSKWRLIIHLLLTLSSTAEVSDLGNVSPADLQATMNNPDFHNQLLAAQTKLAAQRP